MTKLIKAAWAHLFPMPEVSAVEAALARILVAWVLYSFFPVFNPPQVQPVPVGLAHFMDLTWLAQPGVFQLYRQVFFVVLVVYAAGVALPVVLPGLALMHIMIYSLIQSQGFTNHSHHILSVVLLGQALVTVCFPRGSWLQPQSAMNAWCLLASQAGIATTYLLAVCSKLIASDGAWLFKSHYIALDVVKTMRQNYFSALEPRYATEPDGVLWMLNNPIPTALIFDMGFVLEAIIVFSVGTRWLALFFGIATIVMHRCINLLMGLEFYQNESMLAIFFVNVPFLVACVWAWILRQTIRKSTAAQSAS